MSLAIGRLARPRTLALTIGVLAASVASASAATITENGAGDWTLIGTPNSDTITGGNGNYDVIGLGASSNGTDRITVGNGNNFLEADGSCPKGYQDTVTPGYGPVAYCQIDQYSNAHTDIIAAGSGNNLILGGGYKNTITVGNGNNIIYAGGANSNSVTAGNGANLIIGGSGPNTITAGSGANVIYAGGGPDTIKVGSGTLVIYAQNGKTDHITCGAKNNTTVYADTSDVVTGCAHVVTAAAGSAATPPPFGTSVRRHPWGHVRRATPAKHKTAKHKKASTKRSR